MFEAHRLLYHSTLGLRVIEKKKTSSGNKDFSPNTLATTITEQTTFHVVCKKKSCRFSGKITASRM